MLQHVKQESLGNLIESPYAATLVNPLGYLTDQQKVVIQTPPLHKSRLVGVDQITEPWP
jgi:hypothetical protein